MRFTANDSSPQSVVEAGIDGFNVSRIECEDDFICGDADANGLVNVSDVVALLQFVFGDGEPPQPWAAGDVDCSGNVNVTDIVYLIAFIFGDGPEPCAGCP
jgi:hypothetical protein